MSSQPGVARARFGHVLRRLDPLRADAHQDVRREARRASSVAQAEPREPAGLAAAVLRQPTRIATDGDQRADEQRRAEDVQEEREVPAVGAEMREHHAPGFQIISASTDSDGVPKRARASGRGQRVSSALGASPLGGGLASCVAWPRPPPAAGRCERPEDERGDDPAVARARSRRRRHEPEPEDDRARRPIPIADERPRRRVSRRSSAISLGRSRRERREVERRRDAPPPRKRNAPVTCNDEQPLVLRHAPSLERRRPTIVGWTRPRRHLRLLDRDDRGRQLDARPRGGARARRAQGRRRARDRRVLRLPLRRAGGRARAARDARDAGRGDDAAAADAARRGDHGHGGGRARAGDDRRAGAPRPALQDVPEPARGRVRVDPRRADPRARASSRAR